MLKLLNVPQILNFFGKNLTLILKVQLLDMKETKLNVVVKIPNLKKSSYESYQTKTSCQPKILIQGCLFEPQ